MKLSPNALERDSIAVASATQESTTTSTSTLAAPSSYGHTFAPSSVDYRTPYSFPSPPPTAPVANSVISKEDSKESACPPSPPLKPTHREELARHHHSNDDETATTQNVTLSTIASRVAGLSMRGHDSDSDDSGSDFDEDDLDEELKNTEVDTHSPNKVQRDLQHIRSDAKEINDRTKGMAKLQKEQDRKLDTGLDNDNTIMASQDKIQESQDETNEHLKTIIAQNNQRAADNDPTFKEQLEREQALRRNELVERLRAQRKADDLEEQLEKARRSKAYLQKKPSPVLSDKTNDGTDGPRQEKAKKQHQARLQPKTQVKAATKRSKNARTLYG